MIIGLRKKRIILSEKVREQLGAVLNSRFSPYGLVRPARILVVGADEISIPTVAETVGISHQVVYCCCNCYIQQGLNGQHDELRPGLLRSISDEGITTLFRKTLETKPRNGTHWFVWTVATESESSRITIDRIWLGFGLQFPRQRRFKLVKEPFFVEKVRDIAGLYLNPLDKAMAMCMDEKGEIRALDRTYPRLAIGLRYLEWVTSDYVRDGITTLFEELDVANGHILAACKNRYGHQESLQFLKQLDANLLTDTASYLGVDNYASHKYPGIKRGMPTHLRCYIHYATTHASWLNQVEIWFNIITHRAVRQSTLKNVKHMIVKIKNFVVDYNYDSRFLLDGYCRFNSAKVKRLCHIISVTEPSARQGIVH